MINTKVAQAPCDDDDDDGVADIVLLSCLLLDRRVAQELQEMGAQQGPVSERAQSSLYVSGRHALLRQQYQIPDHLRVASTTTNTVCVRGSIHHGRSCKDTRDPPNYLYFQCSSFSTSHGAPRRWMPTSNTEFTVRCNQRPTELKRLPTSTTLQQSLTFPILSHTSTRSETTSPFINGKPRL